jgi:2-methylcitrate dehydratase PrpD
MEIPLTRQLASFCQDSHYQTLPSAVVDRAKYFFLDYLLNNGREVSAHVRFPKGDPENPLSWDELIEKYQTLAGTVWNRQKVETVLLYGGWSRKTICAILPRCCRVRSAHQRKRCVHYLIS